MIITTAIAASLLQIQETKPITVLPKPTLFVENLAIATFSNKQWERIATQITPLPPFLAHSLDIGRIKDTRPIYEVNFLSEMEANFIEYSGGAPVLWSGPRPKFPRSIRFLNPEQSDYLLVVKDFIKAQSKSEPPYQIEINTIARIDLDGDGQEEVLIQAQSKGFTTEVDWSDKPKMEMNCTLIRHIKSGKAVTEPFFYFTSDPTSEFSEPIQTTSILAVADLDGDGNYEVIVSANYYEGQSATVYNLSKGTLKTLVQNGAGV